MTALLSRKLRAGYGPDDTPAEPKPSAYDMDSPEGRMAYGRACARWALWNDSEPHDPTNPWQDDPKYPSADWQHEVLEGNTRLGYLDWVAHQHDQEASW